MGEVLLPLVEPSTRISQAIGTMRRRERSAVVIVGDQGPVVLALDDLVEALRETGDVSLAEVTPSRRTDLDPLTAQSDRTNPENDYLVQSHRDAQTARVVIADAGLLAAALLMPLVCKCPDGHVYTQTQAQTRRFKCSKCPSRKTISCHG